MRKSSTDSKTYAWGRRSCEQNARSALGCARAPCKSTGFVLDVRKLHAKSTTLGADGERVCHGCRDLENRFPTQKSLENQFPLIFGRRICGRRIWSLPKTDPRRKNPARTGMSYETGEFKVNIEDLTQEVQAIFPEMGGEAWAPKQQHNSTQPHNNCKPPCIGQHSVFGRGL